MMNAVRANAVGTGGARLFCASRILILILAIAPAFATAQAVRDVVKGNPRLASLQVEIWPEFDRPAAALVILKGEIAADVRLPAAVSMRIPATSGGPTAVAYVEASGGSLANLNYERQNAGDFIMLKFDAPTRVFHIEFYDPLAKPVPGQSYTYTYAWTGDLAADTLRMVVQEPATASDISVQPALATTVMGQDGLRYRSADLGRAEAGKRLEVSIRYTKADPRASTEILKPKAAAASPPPGAEPSAEPGAGPSKMELATWLVGIVAVLGLGLGVWAGVMWWYGRNSVPKPNADKTGFCGKCGTPRASGARFCSKCGAKLA